MIQKGTMTRDFRHLVFSSKNFPLGPWCTGQSLFECNIEFSKLFEKRCHWHRCETSVVEYIREGSKALYVEIWLDCTMHMGQRCHWHSSDIHSSINDTAVQIGHLVFCDNGDIDNAVTKIGDFAVDFLREFEIIFKKSLNCVSRA
jgi:hypothetical protein